MRIPPATGPTSWRRFASFESSLNGEVDFGWRADSPFQVSRTSEAGGADEAQEEEGAKRDEDPPDGADEGDGEPSEGD